MKLRKNLSGEALHGLISEMFKELPDHRKRVASNTFSIHDALMSGFAIFALKFSSLLQLDQQKKDFQGKLHSLFGIRAVPSDTQLREIVDNVDPEFIRPVFKQIFSELQRGKCLEEYAFYKGHYLIPVDGTGYFSSEAVHCEDCLVKEYKTGITRYQHQMLAACIVHPQKKIVIPLCPEPIKKQDGTEKNDCEQNAGKRFVKKFREDHPKFRAIFVQDALSGKHPWIQELKSADIRFIIGAKPGSNPYIFERVERLEKAGKMMRFQKEESSGQKIEKKVTHKFRYFNNMTLTGDHDTQVNFFEYWETIDWIDKDGVTQKDEKHFSWITDFEINETNLMILMRGGRARWAIENETFNTLKNQGYEFEHNFGHGYNHLTTCFAFLMMLAFLADQVQQLSCDLFQKALAKVHGNRQRLWRTIRVLFEHASFSRWNQLLEVIANGKKWELPSSNSS